MVRPARLSVRDELGRTRSLASGPQQFTRLTRGTAGAGGAGALVLGLGPEPAVAGELVEGPVTWLDAPEFLAQVEESWSDRIPAEWTHSEPGQAYSLIDDALAAGRTILAYAPAERLFPSFWGPILAHLRLCLAFPAGSPARTREIWLPGEADALLTRELAWGFAACGWDVRLVPAQGLDAALPGLLAHGAPELVVSVNGRGLDPHGRGAALLAAAGAELAIWFVDNPFHVLSGVQSPFWRGCSLWVTDDWFMAPLRAHGAQRVGHLPLAGWPDFALGAKSDDDAAAGLKDRAVFVGRSAFPGREGFFAGLRLPEEVLTQARDLLAVGGRPDLGWWLEALGEDPARGGLWPGKGVRLAGLGAETLALEHRAAMLRTAAGLGTGTVGLTVFGDAGWREQELGPGVELRDPVDYYGPLAAIYARAGCVLGPTSLQLPQGLTQRHFDVWLAGGLLLSDTTPGLTIFPEELTREISATPADLPALMHRFAREPGLRDQLIGAWRELILARHTYAHRAATVLESLGLNGVKS